MTDLLSRLPIAWPFLVNVVVALTAIAVARVQVARQSRKTAAATGSHRAVVASQSHDPDRPPDMRDVAAPDDGVWAEPMPAEAWSALVQARLERLTSLPAGDIDAFDTAALLRRVMYSTYLDCRELDPIYQLHGG